MAPRKAYKEHELYDMLMDDWLDEVRIGAHITLAEDGPWVERGPPTITRELTIVGSCAAINSRGGGCYLNANGWVENLLRISGSEAKVTLRNIRFQGVDSADAGALAIDMGATVDAHYCDFARNKAAQGAGATVRDPESSAAFHFCTFWENSAQSNGGAMYVGSSTASLTNCTFTQNEGMYGGAIAIESAAVLNSENSTFVDNNAFVFGDDVYVSDPSSSRAYFLPFPTEWYAVVYPSTVGKQYVAAPPVEQQSLPKPPRPPHPPYPPPSPPRPPKPRPPPNPPPPPPRPVKEGEFMPPPPPPPPIVTSGRPFPFGSSWSWDTSISFFIWFIIGCATMAFLVLTVVFHKRIFSPIPWDYTRIKLEEPPEQAALRRLHAAAGGSGNLTGRLGDLERQEKAEVVGDTPTMLHLMGQNNLLQRTGFRGGETELEDE